MPVFSIAEYSADLRPAVEAFNARLQRGGVAYRFREAPPDGSADAPIVERGFVALQDGRDVRGGYRLKEQDFWLNGRRVRIGNIQLPLSEGLVDRTYSTLAAQLFAHALKRQPLMFGLGIGGRDETFARIVSALGWTTVSIPFHFRPLRPFRMARRLTYARRTRSRRLMLDVAAWSGAAWLAGICLRAAHPVAPMSAEYSCERCDSLLAWTHEADDLWQRCRGDYQFVGWRDRQSLALMYPTDSRDYLRFRLRHRGVFVGWAVALDTQMVGHKHFGDLRVATIVDCVGERRHATALVACVSRYLDARGVDMIVSNQASPIWGDALRDSGFQNGPSNFLFAASPRLAQELAPPEERVRSMHLTRGDGDGPINL